ncbi:MAG: hypothetical protein R3E97_04160 [Candidatus Eisenbacteria bacterium]
MAPEGISPDGYPEPRDTDQLLGDVELRGDNESTIAVNPLDPSNLACSSMFQLRVSTNGGRSFTSPEYAQVPITHSWGGDPVVSFDADGRLYWTYLAWHLGAQAYDIFLAECDPKSGGFLPGFPVNVTAQVGMPAGTAFDADKQWLAIDTWPESPFLGSLYLVWTNFSSSGSTRTFMSHSTDHGVTWSAPTLVGGASSFNWATHVTVAPDGDVYCGWFELTPRNISLQRSTDRGVTWVPTTRPFGTSGAYPGFNVVGSGDNIPGTRFWTQGACQPWILCDPLNPSTVHVVVNDDPDATGSGEPPDVYIATSVDDGRTWTQPRRVDSGPSGTLQTMPTASIDRESGAIVVVWYDNRRGLLNEDGNYLLDTQATFSLDGGLTFVPDFRINDDPFDPDRGAPCRWNCGRTLWGVWTDGPNYAIACGSTGTLYIWDGWQWGAVSTGTSETLYGVWATSTGEIWAVGDHGRILRFDGHSWQTQSSGVNDPLLAIAGRSAEDIYAAGFSGILHWDGASWNDDAAWITGLTDVTVLPDGTAWAVGIQSTVFHHDGDEWVERIGPPRLDTLTRVWASSERDVWVSGYDQYLYHWDGIEWTEHTVGESIRGIWGTSATNVYFAGRQFVARWNGTGFEVRAASATQPRQMFGSSAENVFIVGSNGRASRFDGRHWNDVPTPGVSNNATLRIGEYNGVASGIGAVAIWTGSRFGGDGNALAQQGIFDAFELGTSASEATGLAKAATTAEDAALRAGANATSLSSANPDAGQVVDPSADPIVHAASVALLELEGPNPFRWVTRVTYLLPAGERVQAAIYASDGRIVKSLAGRVSTGERETLVWDGRGSDGRTVPAGVYFLRVRGDGRASERKLTLVK